LLDQHQFSAVLLDVSMPQEQGSVSLLRSLKRRCPGVPVLLICPVDAVDLAGDAMKAGLARDYISPPFLLEVLAARVEACLRTGAVAQGEAEGLPEERQRSAYLLNALLPQGAVRELEESGRILPRRASEAVLLAWDVEGFSDIADAGQPQDVLSNFQDLMVAFEEIARRNGMEKIRTCGASCLAIAGLFEENSAPTTTATISAAVAAVRCALEFRDAARTAAADWRLRIGVHQGAVLAGVVGHRCVRFDVWGAAVETTSLVKMHGLTGAVNVSSRIWEQAHGHCLGEALNPFPLPEGGSLGMFRVDRLT
jgi:class 3 adenylate cyclase